MSRVRGGLPLPPLDGAHVLTYPPVQLLESLLDPTEAEGGNPAARDAVELRDGVRKLLPATSPEQRPELRFQPLLGLGTTLSGGFRWRVLL